MTRIPNHRRSPFGWRSPSMLLLALLALAASACAQVEHEPFQSGLVDAEGADTDSAAPAPDPDPGCDAARPEASLRPPDAVPATGDLAAGSYMAEVASRGVLRVGVGADTLLFGYLNPQSGVVEGFDVEMARLVADAIFGDPDRVQLIPVQSSERIAAVESGTVDLVVKTMTITCERWASINFSSLYYRAGQRLLVSTDSGVEQLADVPDGAPICAVSGTTSLQNLTEAGVATFEADTWTGCLIAYQERTAFGVSTDDTILAGLAAQDTTATVVGPSFSDEPYGIGLPKDHPEFTEFVNAVLEEAVSDGTWADLYDQWLVDVLGPAQETPRATYRS